MPDLTLNDEESAWAEVVERAAAGIASLDTSAAWKILGDLGVFGTALPEYGGGPIEVAIALIALGREAIDGPIVSSILAAQCLSGDEQAAVVAGDRVVGMVVDGVFAWGSESDLMVTLTDDRRLAVVEAVGDSEPFRTLAGSHWLLGDHRELDSYPAGASVFALADIAVGAWLVGAADTLVSLSAQHARDRHQFGRAIGSFQAVAHPLAAACAEVDGARDLLMKAAWSNTTVPNERLAAQARLIACRAAMEALTVAHQIHGALGFSSESPVGRFSTRIRQVSFVPPKNPHGLSASVEHGH